MAADKHALLAVRTIVVTTRAAVVSHLRYDRPDLTAATAERGRVLLAELRDRLGSEGRRDLADELEAAEAALEELARSLPAEGSPPAR